jgi:hypothetical protein
VRPVIFHAEAKAELFDAARWYNTQVRGLGSEFRQEPRAAAARIAATPEAFGFYSGNIRFHRLHRFPYALLYEVRPHEVFVVAVMHLHRHPDYWKHRLD